jgi:acyl-CoA thioesterase-2
MKKAVPPIQSLVSHLRLKRIEKDLFVGQSYDPGWGRVYGGQVLGQALSAAQTTVDDVHETNRHAHSLHSYFLLPGNVHLPIAYDVERIRDGRSFSTRRVKAIQTVSQFFF